MRTLDSKGDVVRAPNENTKKVRSEEHTSELQSHSDLVCRLLLEKKNWKNHKYMEIEQHATEQPMGQQRNQRRNQITP